MACNLASPMDANGAVGCGLEMASIRSCTEFVADSWLDITGTLLCSGGN